MIHAIYVPYNLSKIIFSFLCIFYPSSQSIFHFMYDQLILFMDDIQICRFCNWTSLLFKYLPTRTDIIKTDQSVHEIKQNVIDQLLIWTETKHPTQNSIPFHSWIHVPFSLERLQFQAFDRKFIPKLNAYLRGIWIRPTWSRNI